MDYVLASLELEIKSLYANAHQALAPVPPVVGDNLRLVHHPVHGEFVEVTLTESIPVPVEASGAMFWRHATTQTIDNGQHSVQVSSPLFSAMGGVLTMLTRQERSLREASSTKKYTVALRRGTDQVKLNAVSFMQQFQEADRCLIAYTSMMTTSMRTGSPCFREKSWIELSRSVDRPATATTLRLCYQLYAECPALSAASDSNETSDIRALASFVLASVGSTMHAETKKHHQTSALLSQSTYMANNGV